MEPLMFMYIIAVASVACLFFALFNFRHPLYADIVATGLGFILSGVLAFNLLSGQVTDYPSGVAVVWTSQTFAWVALLLVALNVVFMFASIILLILEHAGKVERPVR